MLEDFVRQRSRRVLRVAVVEVLLRTRVVTFSAISLMKILETDDESDEITSALVAPSAELLPEFRLRVRER